MAQYKSRKHTWWVSANFIQSAWVRTPRHDEYASLLCDVAAKLRAHLTLFQVEFGLNGFVKTNCEEKYSIVVRAPAQCIGVHGFYSCQGYFSLSRAHEMLWLCDRLVDTPLHPLYIRNHYKRYVSQTHLLKTSLRKLRWSSCSCKYIVM